MLHQKGDIDSFCALPGTNPIYTDRDSTVEKYGNLSNSMKHFAIPFVLLTLLLWFATIMSSGILNSVLLVIATIFTIIAVPTAWTLIASYKSKWKDRRE